MLASPPTLSERIPFVHTQDDYDTLPVGSPYRDSSGKLAVKSPPPQPIQVSGAMNQQCAAGILPAEPFATKGHELDAN